MRQVETAGQIKEIVGMSSIVHYMGLNRAEGEGESKAKGKAGPEDENRQRETEKEKEKRKKDGKDRKG